VAAAYSARPYKLLTVSVPLEWREVTHRLDLAAFTINTMFKREKKGEIWQQILNEKVVVANSKIPN